MCKAIIEWEAEAKEIGENIKLIKLVQRKLRKGNTAETIAEDLDELFDNVERICAAVKQCGLDADPQEIYDKMQNMILTQ